MHGGLGSWNVPRGTARFESDKCHVQNCELTDNGSRFQESDVVLYKHLPYGNVERPLNQVRSR